MPLVWVAILDLPYISPCSRPFHWVDHVVVVAAAAVLVENGDNDDDDGNFVVVEEEAAPLLLLSFSSPPPHNVVIPANGLITNPNGKSPHLRSVALSIGKLWTVLLIIRGETMTLCRYSVLVFVDDTKYRESEGGGGDIVIFIVAVAVEEEDDDGNDGGG